MTETPDPHRISFRRRRGPGNRRGAGRIPGSRMRRRRRSARPGRGFAAGPRPRRAPARPARPRRPGPDGGLTFPTSEQPGTIIAGRYKLLEEIGEGGMGTVWVAEQTQPVRRKVALKLIKAGMDSKSRPGPLRGRAAGAGHDGPPQHRQGARRRVDRIGPALLRHGVRQGRADHRVLRRHPAERRPSG